MKRKSTKRSVIEAFRTWPAAFCVLRQFPSLFQAAGDETDRPHFSLRPSTEPRRRFQPTNFSENLDFQISRRTWEDLIRVISDEPDLSVPNEQKFHLMVHLFDNL